MYIKQQSEIYDFMNIVQNQTGKRIKEIYFDNGTVYLNGNYFELVKQNIIYKLRLVGSIF